MGQAVLSEWTGGEAVSGGDAERPAAGEVPADQTPPPLAPKEPEPEVADAVVELVDSEASPAIRSEDVQVLTSWYCTIVTQQRQDAGPHMPVGEAEFLDIFKRFAHESATRLVELEPPAGGRLPQPDQLHSAHHWYQGLQQVDRNDRAARCRYLEDTLATWLQDLVKSACLELRNALSVALLASEGHWKQFMGANGRPAFQSANHFIKTYLHMWGLGDSNTRVSRLRSSARLWLELEGYHIPVPDSLSRLEHLSARKDGVRIYRALVREGGNQVPSDAAIKARVDFEDGRVRPGKRAPRSQEALGKLVGTLARLVIEENGRDMPAIKETTKELFADYGPNEPRPPKPKKDRLPPWDAKLPCPCRLEEAVMEGGVRFVVHVIDLPMAFADALLREARRDRWKVEETGAGRRILTLTRHGANTAELNAWRHYVNHWACWVCRLFGAPAPQPQDMLVTPPPAAGAA